MNRILMVAACVALFIKSSTSTADVFRFVALPDTQIYSENIPPGTPNRPPVTDPLGTGHIFADQTRWIVDNAAALNIRYVGHLGDIIQNGEIPAVAAQEWTRSKAAMDKLHNADIPYGTVMGNHDDNGSHGPTYSADYLNYFGPQNFVGKSWYAGSSPSGGGNYQLLDHEGQKVGFINFSIDHPQGEIDWANSVIQSNPDTLFIVGTHRYLYDYKLISGRYGEVNVTPLGTFQITEDFVPPSSEIPQTGQQLFEQLVNVNPNVMMIQAGHFHSEWLRLTDRPGNEKVIEMLTDYQDGRNGGDGWMRIYSIDRENNTFSWETYSPTAEVPDYANGGTKLGGNRSTLHHLVETISQAWSQRIQVMQVLGLLGPNPSQVQIDTVTPLYVALLSSTPETQIAPGVFGLGLKDTAAPDNFLALHPEWDAAYFSGYLADMFDVPNGGVIPAGFDNILEWEGLWFGAFAGEQTPSDPFGFAPGVRSPSGSLSVNYANFVVPEPTSVLLMVSLLLTLPLRIRRLQAERNWHDSTR